MGRKCEGTSPMKSYSIRMTEETRNALLKNAKMCGVSSSEYLRRMVIGRGKIDWRRDQYRDDMLAAMSKIGNNINQIAKWANSNQGISQASVNQVWDELIKISKMISEEEIPALRADN